MQCDAIQCAARCTQMRAGSMPTDARVSRAQAILALQTWLNALPQHMGSDAPISRAEGVASPHHEW